MSIIDNIYIGVGILDKVFELTQNRNVVYVTDTNVGAIYSDFFATKPTITIALGEVNKTLATIEQIHTQLLALGADRNIFIVGVGGGIVTDIVGFAASTYMRGVDFGFVATTFMAQIDASVGGKNGVNIGGFKNIAGVFNKPQFVICDVNFLSTLPTIELTSAWSEIIKYALIADPSLMLSTDNEDIVRRCVAIKTAIVAEDFTEQGRRKLLNLGHTIGHSIEKLTDGTCYLHGQAVAIGIAAIAQMSVKLALLSGAECEAIINALAAKGLPTQIPQSIDKRAIADAAMSDKKHAHNGIDMIFLQGIGKPIIRHTTAAELIELL